MSYPINRRLRYVQFRNTCWKRKAWLPCWEKKHVFEVVCSVAEWQQHLRHSGKDLPTFDDVNICVNISRSSWARMFVKWLRINMNIFIQDTRLISEVSWPPITRAGLLSEVSKAVFNRGGLNAWGFVGTADWAWILRGFKSIAYLSWSLFEDSYALLPRAIFLYRVS
jgi:hypothetical protein